MIRYFCCFQEKPIVERVNPLIEANPLPDKLKRLPDTLQELIYLHTMAILNLNSFNKEAELLALKAETHMARGDMYKGMFFLKQRRIIVEESSKLVSLLDDIKEKRKYLEEFPAEFRAAQKIKF
jgi:hypothetical protein